MKVIDTALSEMKVNPRQGWWGFFDGQKHYLMRYEHIMVIWIPGCVLKAYHETKTDKAGVFYAIEKIKKMTLDDFLSKYDETYLREEQSRMVALEKYEEAAKIQKELISRQNRVEKCSF